MVQNGATLKQSASEPVALKPPEPHPAEPPPAPGAPDLHAPVPLTPKQMLAFPYIVSAPSLSKAAEAAQVGRNTTASPKPPASTSPAPPTICANSANPNTRKDGAHSACPPAPPVPPTAPKPSSPYNGRGRR